MRTDCLMEGDEVVAIVLDDVSEEITFSCAEVKASILAGGFGEYRKMARDFLSVSANTTIIKRGRSDRKRKCCVIKLKRLPQDVQARLKSGKST